MIKCITSKKIKNKTNLIKKIMITFHKQIIKTHKIMIHQKEVTKEHYLTVNSNVNKYKVNVR